MWESSVPSHQFCYEPKTALKNKLLKSKLNTKLEIHYMGNPVCGGGGNNYCTELTFMKKPI